MNNEPVAWMHKKTGELVVFGHKPKHDWWIPLYTHPAKNLSLQKVDGELVAVTYTDDEHRIIEVLWEKPPAKTLTDEEIMAIVEESYMPQGLDKSRYTGFAREILRKAQKK